MGNTIRITSNAELKSYTGDAVMSTLDSVRNPDRTYAGTMALNGASSSTNGLDDRRVRLAALKGPLASANTRSPPRPPGIEPGCLHAAAAGPRSAHLHTRVHKRD